MLRHSHEMIFVKYKSLKIAIFVNQKLFVEVQWLKNPPFIQTYTL